MMLEEVPTVRIDHQLSVSVKLQSPPDDNNATVPTGVDQSFLHLRNQEDGHELIRQLKDLGKGTYKYTLKKKVYKSQLAAHPGTYSMAVIFGGLEHEGIVQSLGSIRIPLSADEDNDHGSPRLSQQQLI
ncbi:hypothetical protein EV182_003490, partial [Spiromyces aspiralis]